MESLPGTGQRHHTSLPPSDHLKREKKKSYLHYNNKTLEMKRNGDVLCHLGSPVFFLSYVSVCACVLLLFIFFPFFFIRSPEQLTGLSPLRQYAQLTQLRRNRRGRRIYPAGSADSVVCHRRRRRRRRKEKKNPGSGGKSLLLLVSILFFVGILLFFSFTCFLFEPFEINEGAPTLGDLIADRLMNLMLLLWLP